MSLYVVYFTRCALLVYSVHFFCLPVSPRMHTHTHAWRNTHTISQLPPVVIFILQKLIFSHSLHPSCCRSVLVYLFCQRAVVWDIPVYTVIHYGLSSFIGALLSCKAAQGSFFSLAWNQFIADIYSGMTFSGFVFQRQTVYITSYWVVLPLL